MQPDHKMRPPSAQVGPKEGKSRSSAPTDWLNLAQRAFRDSTDYMDVNYRKKFEDSIRAFNNQHPTDSKYGQLSYEKRSRLYRPRTRAVIRKNEAAGAAAFFSNMEVVTIQAQDQTSKVECASAAVMKEMMQYRLTKSIPWYQTVLGGLQDAQTVGVCCAHIYWDYQEEPGGEITEEESPALADVIDVDTASNDEIEEFPEQDLEALPSGTMVAKEGGLEEGDQPQQIAPTPSTPVMAEPRVIVDKPCIDLIPVENIRFDPGASWTDPVNTSPYWIHLMPMYAMDVKERMRSGDWITYADDIIAAAADVEANTVRRAREKGNDPTKSETTVSDYEIVWVQRHIHKRGGKDWEFYTLSDLVLLCEPYLLKETVFHGKRPYVMGNCILETHKTVPTSVPELGRGLQDEINEVANGRIDNVKFVLNKKWFVKRGKEADVMGLVRNVPGGVVMLDDPINDVREVTWPDVTGSSFQEHQLLNQEMDELLGNFNPAALMTQGTGNNPARNMQMLANSSGTLTEYMLRTFVETFVQPVLRQVILLEQECETDQVVMKIAGKRAEIFQKYGIDNVTDELLTQELTLTVNVGMGATDPMQKLQKFLTAFGAYTEMLKQPAPGVNMQEVGKEIFGHLGYSDGSRFFTNDNPQIIQLQQQLQQAGQLVQQLNQKLADKQSVHQVKLAAIKMTNDTKLQIAANHEANENKRSLATHWRALHEHNSKLESERKAAASKPAEQPKAVEKPAPAPVHKPPDIHVHMPENLLGNIKMPKPKRSRSKVERDDKGELVGTTNEYDYEDN